MSRFQIQVKSMEDEEVIRFDDLAESKEFQRFFELARELTGILVTLVTPDGSRAKFLHPREIETPLCRLINDISAGRGACHATDRCYLQKTVSRKQALYYLCHAGLVDMMIPIYVNGHNVAVLNCGQVLPKPPSNKGFRQFCRKLSHFHFPLKTLRHAYFSSPHCSVERIKTIVKLFTFFAEYFGEVGWRLKQMNEKEFLPVQFARRHIHEHFREPLKLADIARKVSLSPAYFSSLFHRHTGMTVMACLQFARINAAKELLTKTSERITDIAFDIGFNNLTHFNRIFRKITRCSPREYRRKNRPRPRSVKSGLGDGGSASSVANATLRSSLPALRSRYAGRRRVATKHEGYGGQVAGASQVGNDRKCLRTRWLRPY